MFKKRSFVIVLLIFTVISCKPESVQDANIIAKVNNAVLTLEEIEKKVPEDTNSEVQRALKRQLMEKWIEEELFYQAALDEGYELDEAEREYVDSYEKYLLVKKFMDMKLKCFPSTNPTFCPFLLNKLFFNFGPFFNLLVFKICLK